MAASKQLILRKLDLKNNVYTAVLNDNYDFLSNFLRTSPKYLTEIWYQHEKQYLSLLNLAFFLKKERLIILFITLLNEQKEDLIRQLGGKKHLKKILKTAIDNDNSNFLHTLLGNEAIRNSGHYLVNDAACNLAHFLFNYAIQNRKARAIDVFLSLGFSIDHPYHGSHFSREPRQTTTLYQHISANSAPFWSSIRIQTILNERNPDRKKAIATAYFFLAYRHSKENAENGSSLYRLNFDLLCLIAEYVLAKPLKGNPAASIPPVNPRIFSFVQSRQQSIIDDLPPKKFKFYSATSTKHFSDHLESQLIHSLYRGYFINEFFLDPTDCTTTLTYDTEKEDEGKLKYNVELFKHFSGSNIRVDYIVICVNLDILPNDSGIIQENILAAIKHIPLLPNVTSSNAARVILVGISRDNTSYASSSSSSSSTFFSPINYEKELHGIASQCSIPEGNVFALSKDNFHDFVQLLGEIAIGPYLSQESNTAVAPVPTSLRCR